MSTVGVSAAGLTGGGVPDVGVGLTAAGMVLEAEGAEVGALRPDEEVWRGLSRDGFVHAAHWQGRATTVLGRAAVGAGDALHDYATVLAAAQQTAGEGRRLAQVGTRRVQWAFRVWVAAAAAGDAATAADAVSAARTGAREHHHGTALQQEATARVQDAATETITRLRAATEVAQSAGEATNPLTADDGWTLADLLLAPVTTPAGLVNGAVVEPVRGLVDLASTVWTDPELRRRALLAASGGPTGLATAAGAAAASFGIRQGEQLAHAAATDGISGLTEELADDTVDTARLAADVTGATDLVTGLREGNLYQAATGAGAAADLLLGSHGLGTTSKAATAAETLTDLTTRGLDDLGTTGIRGLADDELDLVIGGTGVPEQVQAGRFVDEGGYGEIREVVEDPDLVVKTAKSAIDADIVDEAESLELATETGLPTVYRGMTQVVDFETETAVRGILMDRLDGPNSDWVMNRADDPARLSAAGVNARTVADLERIRDVVRTEKLALGDFEFMVSSETGAVYVVDTSVARGRSDAAVHQSVVDVERYLGVARRAVTGRP